MTDLIKEQYPDYLLNNGLSDSTVKSYSTDIKLFLKYVEKNNYQFDGEITRTSVIEYKDFLISNDASVATINKKMNSILSFNNFLIDKGYMNCKAVHSRDKVRIAYGSEHQVSILSDEDLSRLKSLLKDGSKVSVRNKLIIYMLLYTGVRVSELVNIKLTHINNSSKTLLVTFGKGGVNREIPLKEELLTLIELYFTTARLKNQYRDSPFLFLSQRSNKMHRDAINRVLNRVGKQLNIHMHPHIFRHTIFTKLVRKGIPLSTVAALAGHSNIQTTVKSYVNTSREEKRSAIDLL